MFVVRNKMDENFIGSQLNGHARPVVQLVLASEVSSPWTLKGGDHTRLTFIQIKQETSTPENHVNMSKSGFNNGRDLGSMSCCQRKCQIIRPHDAFHIQICFLQNTLEVLLFSESKIDVLCDVCHENMENAVCQR